MHTRILSLAAVLLLTACATAPTPTPTAGATRTAGGGYYLDDGPGTPPPDDVLARVAEPIPRMEPLHRGAMKPYEVLGRRFTPQTALAPYKAQGLATYYGRRYNGKPTSTGEPYRMYEAYTAAHATLPLPSYARVTNLDNGRSVIVRLNDRGPFIEPDRRIIDVSYLAAWKLGFVGKGTARVEVEQILPGQEAASLLTPPAAPAETRPLPVPDSVQARHLPDLAAPAVPRTVAPGAVWLQLGAFASAAGAQAQALRLQGMDTGAARPEIHPGNGLYRLRLGPFPDPAAARAILEGILRPQGLEGFVTR